MSGFMSSYVKAGLQFSAGFGRSCAALPGGAARPVLGREVLRAWCLAHQACPYLAEADVELLAGQTQLTPRQLRDWVSNWRRRHWRPSKKPRPKPAAAELAKASKPQTRPAEYPPLPAPILIPIPASPGPNTQDNSAEVLLGVAAPALLPVEPEPWAWDPDAPLDLPSHPL